jgi:hypothetical protein
MRNMVAIVALLAIASQARAQEQMQVARTLYCDTQEQLESLMTADDAGNFKVAWEDSKKTCGTGTLVYTDFKTLHRVQTKQGTFDVTEVTVIAKFGPEGLVAVPPTKRVVGIKVVEHGNAI